MTDSRTDAGARQHAPADVAPELHATDRPASAAGPGAVADRRDPPEDR